MTDVIRVLLIDDDENSFALTKQLLARGTRAKYRLDWAQSFEAGLASLHKDDFDVCLLNYGLGARTGLDLLADALPKGFRSPVIMLTPPGADEIDVKVAQDIEKERAETRISRSDFDSFWADRLSIKTSGVQLS